MRAVEANFEGRLRGSLLDAGDDLDLQAVFLAHADNTRTWCDHLAEGLGEVPGPDQVHSLPPRLAEAPPVLTSANRIQEERAVQNLIVAFTIHSTERAMSEVLALLSAATGDIETERLGQEIQRQAQQSAERVFSLIRSRAKIAFNMLTPHELDPAVETKMADDRVI